MNVKVENVEKNKVKLTIEVEAEKFEQAMEKSYKKNVKKYNVQGFRKGKAPRKILERYYGEGILYEDAFNFVAGEAYDQAIKEKDIFAVSRPEIDIEQIESGKNLIFTAEVIVKPDIEIKDYKGIEVKKVEYNVTDEEVDKEIERMQEKNARTITIEDRELRNNDIATIDFEGFMEGVPFEGGKGENYDLEIGKRTFIEGFEEQLIGMNINDEKEIKVTFPEDYHSKNLAGKEASFKVLLHSVKQKEIPELDDEFAKDVSECDTLDELKKDIKEKLQKTNEEKAKKEMEDQIIDKIIEDAVVDIPQVMIENQLDNIVKDFEMRLRMQGATLDTYLKYTNTDYNKFRIQFTEQAEKTVKTQLALEKIGKEEKIEATEAELENKLVEIAKGYSQEVEEFKKHLREEDIEYIRKEIEVDKIMKVLMDNSKHVKVKKEDK